MLFRALSIAALILFLATATWPHGGGLDSYGCHHNRIHGGYHCHRGPLAGAMFDSQAEMLHELEAQERTRPHRTPTPPVVVREFSGQVVGISDGDTITVMHNGKGERIRLHGIDCPEKRQPFGNKAKQVTSEQAFGKTVTVIVLDKDRYGRTVGEVILPDGKSLNHRLVQAGFAWHYTRYSDDQALANAELEARKERRGLWVDAHPVPPWEWRMARKNPRDYREP